MLAFVYSLASQHEPGARPADIPLPRSKFVFIAEIPTSLNSCPRRSNFRGVPPPLILWRYIKHTHTHYRSTTLIPGPFSALISRTRCEPSPGHSWTFLLRGLPQSRGEGGFTTSTIQHTAAAIVVAKRSTFLLWLEAGWFDCWLLAPPLYLDATIDLHRLEDGPLEICTAECTLGRTWTGDRWFSGDACLDNCSSTNRPTEFG